MKVVVSAPHTGPLTFALGTGVVWIPPLTSEALVDSYSRVPWSSIKGFHTFVVLEAQEDSTANHPLLGFLIFQTNYDFIRFWMLISKFSEKGGCNFFSKNNFAP